MTYGRNGTEPSNPLVVLDVEGRHLRLPKECLLRTTNLSLVNEPAILVVLELNGIASGD